MCAYLTPIQITTTRRATHNLSPTHRIHHLPLLQKPIRMSNNCFPDAPPGSIYRRELPNEQVGLNSAQGKKLFRSALQQGNAEAFFPLVSQFQTQSHPALCGLTTLSTVLNALEIDPNRVWTHPWRWFAESLLDCCLDMARIKSIGITLDQLARTARCQGTEVEVLRRLEVENARQIVVDSVRGREDASFEFIVASYDRRSLGQTGSGHFSPIAAYDRGSDSVLVLDVARFKYGPHWIPFQDLFDATRPVDTATGMPRGFMTIRKASVSNKEDGTRVADIPCKICLPA